MTINNLVSLNNKQMVSLNTKRVKTVTLTTMRAASLTILRTVRPTARTISSLWKLRHCILLGGARNRVFKHFLLLLVHDQC